MKKRKTSEIDLERIWIEREISSWWFDAKKQRTYNSIQATIDFLKSAEVIAKNQGFEDVVVNGSYCIVVQGWRLETDEEYKNRLKNLLSIALRDKETFEQRKRYYQTGYHQVYVTKLENAIEAIRKTLS